MGELPLRECCCFCGDLSVAPEDYNEEYEMCKTCIPEFLKCKDKGPKPRKLEDKDDCSS